VKATGAREFFEELRGRALSVPPGEHASYRFDIEGTGSWRVTLAQGRADVTEGGGPADCAIATDERTFVDIVNGERSPMAAFLAGKIRVEGDMRLALRLRDLFG
jgi:putative sterol carrier protein